MTMSARSGANRVVIVGAGFGGLAAASALAKTGADITLIDRRNHHLFQPLLYQVATAGLAPTQIASPIRMILRRQSNIHIELDEVTGVDLARRQVELGNGPSPMTSWCWRPEPPMPTSAAASGPSMRLA